MPWRKSHVAFGPIGMRDAVFAAWRIAVRPGEDVEEIDLKR
jgi:hypothetical protein